MKRVAPVWGSFAQNDRGEKTSEEQEDLLLRRMPVVTVTDAQLRDAASKAQEVAKELNAMFKAVPLRQLLRERRVSFCYHPSVINGSLGEAYKTGTIEWANGGALKQLMNMLDKDVPGKAPQFCGGTLGSVWFDVDLTGGAGDYPRTKQVRVTPVKDEETGEWNIILDNTFDETW